MKGIYLAACKARHNNYDIVYQDIEQDKYNTDLGGDMLETELTSYDYIIATPPCNYWSKVNAYYKTSEYALKTKHLLPDIIDKLSKLNKPFIIENVKNYKRLKENGVFELINKYPNNFIYTVGRHIYITNIMINLNCSQSYDFRSKGYKHTVRLKNYVQGGENVYKVIEIWLNYIHKAKEEIS